MPNTRNFQRRASIISSAFFIPVSSNPDVDASGCLLLNQIGATLQNDRMLV
jgi:hypothetical protein